MRGGKRDGAGRKAGVPNKSNLEIRELLDSNIDFSVVVQRLMELVEGITIQETRANGDEVIYTRAPDSTAAKVLLEYMYGKPKQNMEVDIFSDGIKKIVITPASLRNDNPTSG